MMLEITNFILREKMKNRKLAKLGPGESHCPDCGGSGIFKIDDQRDHNKIGIVDHILCDKCLGTGKLDWVEKIVGKEEKKNILEVYNEELKLKVKELSDKIDEDIKNMYLGEWNRVKSTGNTESRFETLYGERQEKTRDTEGHNWRDAKNRKKGFKRRRNY